MSFSRNGQQRYGHVPPPQYGPPGSQDSNRPNSGLQRQSSFDNGDDAAFFEQTNSNKYQPAPAARPHNAHEELFMTSSGPASPSRSSYAGSTSPAMSGYQHQYHGMPAGVRPLRQPAYNPQLFDRTQPTTQASQHQQSTYGNTSSYASPAPAPYNPQNYQGSPPSAHPSRQPTASGYPSYTPVYPSAPQSQQQTYWNQQQQYVSQSGTHHIYQQSAARPTYAPQGSTALPRQRTYNQTPPAPYPNGDTFFYDDYRAPVAPHVPSPNSPIQGQRSEEPNYTNRARRSSTLDTISAPPLSMPMGPQSAGPDGPRLERHPTNRPLPKEPTNNGAGGSDDLGLGIQSTEEFSAQDQLFASIIGDLGHPSSNNRREQPDLLDSELGDVRKYNPTISTTASVTGPEKYASNASRISHNSTPVNFPLDDDSDLEGAAGLEAMRLAEEQDAQLGGFGIFGVGGTNSSSLEPPAWEDSSGRGEANNMDLSLVGGGYAAHMSYGNDLGQVYDNELSSEAEDQSRPLPTPYNLSRSDSYSHAPSAGLGGMTDYALTDNIHPFPAFEAARVDNGGTGGLQRPSSHPHRMSFDEGDEASLRSRQSESRQSERSGSESPVREEMPELFYHPGIGTSSYNLNRPLPAVPAPMSENRTPQLLAAGSYRHHGYSSSYGAVEGAHQTYMPIGPDGHPQGMLNPGNQYVPRSTSLSSHSSAPQTVPPTRSKTDVEERARAQRILARQMGRSGTGIDGYDTIGSTPQSTVTLDLPALPAGRRKKFSPSRLAPADFQKCQKPWALSGIAMWIREMAGGETGEGEPDLRQKTIEEGVVALFTHKVPTMNTADAETLSSKVVKSFFYAGILMEDEEWVKFGHGSVSGVLWQLTGSGCYSPKLHEPEIGGRCYSHHCTRTLKKINLHAQKLEPHQKTEDWATFYKMTRESIEGHPSKEVERQNVLHEIVTTEDTYMDQLNVLRVLYRDDLQTWQPPIIEKKKLAKFISSVFGKVEAIKEVNENFLLAQLKYRQKEQGPWVVGFSDIFREWIRKAKTAYLEYSAGFPFAVHLVRKEAGKNLLFQQFLNQARDNPLSRRLDWNTFLKAPITRLQRYSLLLDTVLKNMKADSEEKFTLIAAIEEIREVTLKCDDKVKEQTDKVEMVELGQKIILRPGMERVELNLDHLGRELLHKGDLQRAGGSRFTWQDTHALLFDHYLVLAKTQVRTDFQGNKKEMYDVSKLPIPMQLLMLESTNDDAVQKSSVKGIGAVTTTIVKTGSAADARLQRIPTNATEKSLLQHTDSQDSMNMAHHSVENELGVKAMYPFRVKHLGKTETYVLYAPSAQSRQVWCEMILKAKTRYAAALFAQNAEPFRLRVMADSAFAYDLMSASSRGGAVSVPGTPLERSIRDMERVYGSSPRPGPVCRAQVNCATAFNCFGKSMIAIGTDYGVYTAEASNPRGWTRSVQVTRVTQIAVLEEFSLCLIIADKSLIAYHLDVIVPVSNFPAPQHDSARRAPQKLSGARDVSFFATARMKDRTLVFYKKREGLHSTFKVLEPVFQKASEKKNRLFGRKFGGGATEFFREYDEFYIPTECFTINLFHTYIAISTQKGFELMTLDKKVPMSIPDLKNVKNPTIGNIAARISGQRPLGMFRLGDAEFLLCYEECGVYVDKHGDVSRSVIMEFVGKAKTAALYGAFLVLFDSDFVEIRNAENGRLRQILAGRDVRCLDHGVNPLGVGSTNSHLNGFGTAGSEKRMLKLAMQHPEVSSSQIVLEMVLNENHQE
ncbi:rhoGEF protein-like protein [Calycina marina]|uniref:RhoGEF protein-like protein n=1 Tax=Calycina marina TaxID=1763456 RepID=A0A9P8CDL7_9HELO|nr:rhoGEF protein-like protein [Calycina marina]